MKCVVSRTCREIQENIPGGRSEYPPLPAEEWENKKAYVLLGPPGSGKTTFFEREAARQRGTYITARDFLTFDDMPEWQHTPLFIDGLDETRAGTADPRTSLDSIRAKLHRMGRPRFRLSCREADWFGSNDRDNLKKASPDETVTVLRLEPLSKQDIHRILLADLGIDDPENFVALAEEKSLQRLLFNPQSLNVLAVAVGSGGGWPTSRKEAFDMACCTLLAERNDDHLIAQPDRRGVPDLMNAVGKLCAIQLLTGAAGYSRFSKDCSSDLLGLDRMPEQDRALFRSCLQSKLFESPVQSRWIPIHRQIAEYLAARYLAGLVDNGLPVGRVLALIAGHDGVVVSELRGLSAWLAAHNKSSRAEIIVRDPLGTVLYGDVSGFSPSEKRDLLYSLHQEASANPGFVATLQLDPRLGDLISSDMEERCREILIEPSREDSWQSFIVILIEALHHGERLPGLADPLMKLLRDDTWWPGIRIRSIEPFVRHRRNNGAASAELKALATDIPAGKVQDPDNALLGCLLSTLYPGVISETEIMQYLRLPPESNTNPEYKFFWLWRLPDRSTADQLEALLDELVERYRPLLSGGSAHGLSNFLLRRLPLKLLAGFLRLSGDDVDLTRLFHWLGSAAYAGDWRHYPDSGLEEFQDIREWLENRPGVWKAVLTMGIKECIDQSESGEPWEFSNCMYEELNGRLFGAGRPTDFGLWCLAQAVTTQDANAAAWFLGEAAECLQRGSLNEGLSRNVVSMRLAGYAALQDVFDKRIDELASVRSVSKRGGHALKTEHPDWHDQVKPFENQLRENIASPKLLSELAKVYLGGYLNLQGVSPRERLHNVLAEDENLVDAVLFGLRKTIERDDLPSDRQIIRLGASNQTHPLAFPFMAGLENLDKSQPFGGKGIDERLWRLALAIHYTVPMWPTARHPADHQPHWFSWLLTQHPKVVADVLEESALSRLRQKAGSPPGLQELAHSRDHADVARIAAMPLLRRFPVRCKSSQLSSLNHLLLAARRHCDVAPLLELIDQRHARQYMNVAQRVHWLAAGLCIEPEIYVARLASYVAGEERRIRFLAEAVTRQFDFSPGVQSGRRVPALQLLIRLIGSSYRPYSHSADSDEGELVTPEMTAAGRVRGFIGDLAAISTADASDALEALLSDNNLRPWYSDLMDAAHRQKAVRREAEFVYSEVCQVLDTLNSGAPANAADLTALTLEHLRQTADDIRDGNTSDWRQYWNVDSHNRPRSPRPEGVCRDALLSDLRVRLQPLGMDVEPEVRFADDKRADFCVSFGQYKVPVEVKRSCHRDLWSALRSQLISRYIRDPGTDGHGIYLVLWFGDSDACQPTPDEAGLRPNNSQELECRLKSTLTVEEQLKIRICVIDVARPPL